MQHSFALAALGMRLLHGSPQNRAVERTHALYGYIAAIDAVRTNGEKARHVRMIDAFVKQGSTMAEMTRMMTIRCPHVHGRPWRVEQTVQLDIRKGCVKSWLP